MYNDPGATPIHSRGSMVLKKGWKRRSPIHRNPLPPQNEPVFEGVGVVGSPASRRDQTVVASSGLLRPFSDMLWTLLRGRIPSFSQSQLSFILALGPRRRILTVNTKKES